MGIFLERTIPFFFLGVMLLMMIYPAISWVFQAAKRFPERDDIYTPVV